MTHLPRGVGRALWAAKKCRPPTQSRGGFLPCESARYCISAANCRPVCPLQCISRVPQPRRHTMRVPSPIDCCRLCVASLYRRRADGGGRAASPVSRNNLGGARRWSGATQCECVQPRTLKTAGATRGTPGRIAFLTPVVARTGFVRQRATAADPGIPRANDRRTAACAGTCPRPLASRKARRDADPVRPFANSACQ